MGRSAVRAVICAIFFGLIAHALSPAKSAKAQDMLIGTGSSAGVYHVISETICRLLGRERRRHGINCDHQVGGSVLNLKDLHSKNLDVAIAQSDWHAHAFNGSDENIFPDGPYTELRSLFSVHREIFTIVTGKDSGIKTLDDLSGKRINIGDHGSGHRQNFRELMRFKNWSDGDFAALTAMPSSQHALALCSSRVDAFVYTVGHPNASIMEATSLCGARLLNIDSRRIVDFLKTYPFYKPAIIGSGTYVGQSNDVASFGLAATVVSTESYSEDKVYELVRAVFESFPSVQSAHPSFGDLSEKRMITQHLTAPLHKGAIRYYKERGWL